MNIEEYGKHLEENLKDLVRRLKGKQYQPRPVRRTYIPKGDGRLRGLGIPTVEDKVVQMGVKKILEAIYEADFYDEVSYGFRPGKGCHDALQALDKTVMTQPVNCVVDMDIEKFFDTINHAGILRCLRERIADSKLLRLIARFLKAGVLEEGKLLATEQGTPQGGIISPILANLCLHYALDRWFERKVKPQLRGYARLIRYADDFVVCFQREREAHLFGEMLKERLAKAGLRLSESKSRLIAFGRSAWQRAEREGKRVETFDFLGFTHYGDKTRKGAFKLGRKTASRKFRQKVKELNVWLKRVRNFVELKEWWRTLQLKLVGHYRYYGVSGNYRAMMQFHRHAFKLAYKWINRRSQKRSMSFKKYLRFLEYNPLPQPRIYHSMYALSSS